MQHVRRQSVQDRRLFLCFFVCLRAEGHTLGGVCFCGFVSESVLRLCVFFHCATAADHWSSDSFTRYNATRGVASDTTRHVALHRIQRDTWRCTVEGDPWRCVQRMLTSDLDERSSLQPTKVRQQQRKHSCHTDSTQSASVRTASELQCAAAAVCGCSGAQWHVATKRLDRPTE